MVNATFYTWDKEFNSTAQPPAGTGVALECEFKTPFSILNPTIILIFDGDPHVWNFVHIADLGRYYIINDWSFDRGRWFAACAVDVLASWKTAIAATSQYVVRAASRYNGALSDNFYPITTEVQTAQARADVLDWVTNYADGTIIIGLVNNDGAGVGGVNYYVMTAAQLSALNSFLLSSANWLDISEDEISIGLQKALVDPMQYITKVYWLPVTITATETRDDLPYGWWSLIGVSGGKLTSYDLPTRMHHITIPKHPQSGRGQYVNTAPYTRYSLKIPPFGIYDFDGALLANRDRISYKISVDLRTGAAVCDVFATTNDQSDTDITDSDRIGRYSANVGIPLQLTRIGRDYSNLSIAGAGLTAANSLLSKMGIDSGTFGTVADAVGAAGTSVNSTGSIGTFTDFLSAYPRTTLQATFAIVADDEPARFGRPLMEVCQLSTLSGFIKCSSPHIDGVDCTGAERQMLHDHLTSGFYLV